jgi:hypothetical protein
MPSGGVAPPGSEQLQYPDVSQIVDLLLVRFDRYGR